jgi:hypothetical protein
VPWAAATAGLDGVVHNPNVGTFAGVMSVTTPTGVPVDVWTPEAAKVAGTAPKEHCSIAPVQTRFGMIAPPVQYPQNSTLAFDGG